MSLFTSAKPQKQDVEAMIQSFLASKTVTHVESKSEKDAKRKAEAREEARLRLQQLDAERQV